MADEKPLSDEEIVKEIFDRHYAENPANYFTNGNPVHKKELLELINGKELFRLWSFKCVEKMLNEAISETRKQTEEEMEILRNNEKQIGLNFNKVWFDREEKEKRIEKLENQLKESEQRIREVGCKMEEDIKFVSKFGDDALKRERIKVVNEIFKRIENIADEENDGSDAQVSLIIIKKEEWQKIKEKYGCEHAPKPMIFNTTTLSTSEYLTWKEQVENGDLSECFGCFCKKIRKEEDNNHEIEAEKSNTSPANQKEKIREVINRLYNLNADISLYLIGMKKIPTQENMKEINEVLGEQIKKLKEVIL